jgi:RNA polymerase sigma factor (sigma-70 family)
VVLVHGFTQTLAAWGPVGERLAGRWEVVRVDLPGHGGSGRVRVGFAEAAALVGEAGGAGVYVGYSLGGRLCLRLALDRPDLVRGLVLVGASPGIADPGARAERRAADEALAAEALPEEVQAALAALPEDFRAAVVLCDVAGLSYQEIGEATGVPLGTVRSRIHRGRALLREALA